MVLAIGLVDLIKRLRDEKAADAVTRHERQRGLEEIQAAERGKLVEHQEQHVATCDAVAAVERFGQTPADLIEGQPLQRLRAADVRRRHDQVKRDRMIGRDQVGDTLVAA